MKRRITAALVSLTCMTGSVALAETQLAFINVQQAFDKHPKAAAVVNLAKERDKALAPLRQEIGASRLRLGGNPTSPDLQRQVQQLSEKYEKAAEEYNNKIGTLTKVIWTDIAEIAEVVAKKNKIDLVINGNAAADVNLVIYANQKSLDITSLVLAEMSKR